jgi:hypothetical protein
MKIDTDLIIPYSLAIGLANLILSGILTLISAFVFHFPITGEVLLTNYIIGYIILWITSIDLIEE